MSGITTGTRLEQLENLRRAVDAAITLERRNLALADTRSARAARNSRQGGDLAALERLGVTAAEVKTWAVATGLLPAFHRGRVALSLIKAYEAAHAPEETPA